MSSKVKVVVKIMGNEYTIVSDDSREYVQRVANLVDDRMNEISSGNRTLGTSLVPVLAALKIADDYLKLIGQHDDLSARFDNPTLEIKLLRDELTDLKRMYHDKVTEYDKLNEEFERLSKSISEYETGMMSFREKFAEVNELLNKSKYEENTLRERVKLLADENSDLKSRLKGLETDSKIVVEQMHKKDAENNALKAQIKEKDEEIKYLLDCLEVYEASEIDSNEEVEVTEETKADKSPAMEDLKSDEESTEDYNISDSPRVTEYGSIRINPQKDIL